jgi:TPP-dependent pyruvate/acetoin dehydrogenase alpha subunit
VSADTANPSAAIPAEVLVDIFTRAMRIQMNDEAVRKAIMRGKFKTTYYSPRGQEIIPSAVSALLRDDDQIVTIYRGIHDQIAKGIPLRLLWAEYAGKATGPCKGKGGPMHITHPETGIMVTTGIVGASMPIANGLAMAAQNEGSDRVVVAYFGDGASNIGAFHEALNMASLWKLPVIFVCQNNLYAEHTAFAIGTSSASISARSSSYDMPGVTVDGNEPEAMWAAAKEAIDRARTGGGPTLIEAMTFRFQGHNFGDQSAYIPKEEMEVAKAADPMPRLRQRMVDEGIMDEDAIALLEQSIADEIADALEFALASPNPSLEELENDVYENWVEV